MTQQQRRLGHHLPGPGGLGMDTLRAVMRHQESSRSNANSSHGVNRREQSPLTDELETELELAEIEEQRIVEEEREQRAMEPDADGDADAEVPPSEEMEAKRQFETAD